MKILTGILITLGLIVAVLLFRYLRIRLGLKDKNYGGIQRIPRLEARKETHEEFLPGSYINRTYIDEIHKELEGGLQLTGDEFGKKKKKRQLFLTKKDVLRSYIVDTLLDKPKF